MLHKYLVVPRVPVDFMQLQSVLFFNDVAAV